jgi:hypothetical protein
LIARAAIDGFVDLACQDTDGVAALPATSFHNQPISAAPRLCRVRPAHFCSRPCRS